MAGTVLASDRSSPIDADAFERLLSAGALILLACVAAALVRGQAHLGAVPGLVWFHLATITTALALTPVMLLRRRGDRPHRAIGRVWIAAMILTAAGSLFIRNANHGNFSIIHILSVWTLIQVPLIWWFAHTHRVVRHRRAVRGMVTGALLIAGFFTFPFNRMLGQFLFG